MTTGRQLTVQFRYTIDEKEVLRTAYDILDHFVPEDIIEENWHHNQRAMLNGVTLPLKVNEAMKRLLAISVAAFIAFPSDRAKRQAFIQERFRDVKL
mgnify:CR=1 FL=1